MGEILQFVVVVVGILISVGLLINCYLLHLLEKRLDILEKEVNQFAEDDQN